MKGGGSVSRRDKFAGVEDVQGIERLFDGPHHRPSSAMFALHVAQFANPDAMFAGGCSAKGQGALDHAVRGGFRTGKLLLIRDIHQQDGVKIAIADMAQNWPLDARLCEIGAGLLDRLGQM